MAGNAASSLRNAVISRSGLSPGWRRRYALSRANPEHDRGVRLVRSEIPFRTDRVGRQVRQRARRACDEHRGRSSRSVVARRQRRDRPALGHRDAERPPRAIAGLSRPQQFAGQGELYVWRRLSSRANETIARTCAASDRGRTPHRVSRPRSSGPWPRTSEPRQRHRGRAPRRRLRYRRDRERRPQVPELIITCLMNV